MSGFGFIVTPTPNNYFALSLQGSQIPFVGDVFNRRHLVRARKKLLEMKLRAAATEIRGPTSEFAKEANNLD
ncbi:hypothetical protein [Bradyrhizobium sp. LMTR 3]|uniref:hypothetical protein n=1 Tax=Bradyrhizobium sp. LMTR 3 TaxID=189873 RepID=UPI000A5AEF9F|nr:hypothetical protein [Bradyrhizobium sp. LMTR 3]